MPTDIKEWSKIVDRGKGKEEIKRGIAHIIADPFSFSMGKAKTEAIGFFFARAHLRRCAFVLIFLFIISLS
jgi:hypothetical protein